MKCDFVYFGRYPQSEKENSVSVGEATDENGYYTGSDGAKYAEKGGRYFKVEPIKWRVLRRDDDVATVVADKILVGKRFNFAIKGSYKESEIRRWLNGEFYNLAFDDDDRERVITTEADNGVKSNGGNERACVTENTFDRVFLLSYEEAFLKFGLTEGDRQRQSTPYARKTGAYVDMKSGCGWWWLRSVGDDRGEIVHGVSNLGGESRFSVDEESIYGVVPALQIKICD